ncbi:TPA: DUF6392 family protein, partial [Photobacterium damselae]
VPMIDISQIIRMIGKTPSEIIAAGLLAENKKPKPRFSGDDELVLDMIREGVFLAFDRATKQLIRINLTLLDIDKPKYKFPNELPKPLLSIMTKEYIYQELGSPYETKKPVEFMGKIWGGVEHYRLDRNTFGELSLLLYYAEDQNHIRSITILKTHDVSWGELGN